MTGVQTCALPILTTFISPDQRQHLPATISVSSSTSQWWISDGLNLSITENQDYGIGFGTLDTIRMNYDRTSDNEQISEVTPQIWNITPSYENDFTYSIFFNYTKSSACENGICKFTNGYNLADIRTCETAGFGGDGCALTTDSGFQIKWDIQDLCDSGFTSIESAKLQMYIHFASEIGRAHV